MKVLIVDTVHESLIEGLRELDFEVVLAHDWSISDIKKHLPDFHGLIIRSRFPVGEEILAGAKSLKFIGRVGAGMENIDTVAAQKRNVKLLNAPEGNRDAVGEHALAMLLMLLNNLREADSEVRSGLWKREANRGYELTGRTVGIIGFGQMGSAFAEKLKGFNVEVLAYDNEKSGFGSDYIRECSLKEIQQKAEILSFHVPQKADTLYYFNDEFLNKMKNPFYLINTARGKVVDTSIVVKGLKSGVILGACLDVLEYEKASFENMFSSNDLPKDFDYLVNSDKVVLSPHIAGWTYESNRKMAETIVDKIRKLELE